MGQPSVIPDFFIVGAPKSGTTSLYEYLRQHPDIFMPEAKKETHFFAPDLDHPQRVRGAGIYARLFAAAQGDQCVGEASVGYLHSEVAAERIRACRPDARIIAVLRNPVDMLHALHGEMIWLGRETEQSFAAALDLEASRARGEGVPRTRCPPRMFLYRQWGDYATQLERYMRAFGRERMHVLLFDEFAADPVGCTQDVYRFLGVSDAFEPVVRVENPSKVARNSWLMRLVESVPADAQLRLRSALPGWALRAARRGGHLLLARQALRPPLSPELRTRLQRELEPNIRRLERTLERDLSAWLEAGA